MPPKRRSDLTPEELESVREQDRKRKARSRRNSAENVPPAPQQPRRSSRLRKAVIEEPDNKSSSADSSEESSDNDFDCKKSREKRKSRRKQQFKRRSSLKELADLDDVDAQEQLAQIHENDQIQHDQKRHSIRELAISGDAHAILKLQQDHENDRIKHEETRKEIKESAEQGNKSSQRFIEKVKLDDKYQHYVKKERSKRKLLQLNVMPKFVPDTKLPEAHYLGGMTNECRFCGALHFIGEQRCCQGGTVFIPPERSMPKTLHNLIYDINGPNHKHFHDNVLKYNSLFAFGSIQYQHVKQAPFGVQSAKTRGSIRHFASAIFPNQENHYLFGNFYVLDHVAAAEHRYDTPLSQGLDEEIIKDLSHEFEQNHPFSHFYKNMKQVIEDAEKEGKETRSLRMRIVEYDEYKKHQLNIDLQGTHKGVYSTSRCGDFVSLYTTTDVEQNILPMGINVYLKLGSHIPRPLFSFHREVDSFCYPIIAPYGECGFKERTWKHQPRQSFQERLDEYISNDSNGEHLMWDIREVNTNGHDQNEQDGEMLEDGDSMEDDTVDEDIGSSEEEVEKENLPEKEHDHDEFYDQEYMKTIENRTTNEDDSDDLHFKFKRGELYPIRRKTLNDDVAYESDSDNDDLHLPTVVPDIKDPTLSAEEVDELNAETDDHQAADHPNEDLQSSSAEVTYENPETDEGEDKVEHGKKGAYVSRLEYTLYRSQRRRKFNNRITASGKLGQLYIMDQFSRVLQNRMYHIRQHYTQSIRSNRKKLLIALQNRANRRKAGITIGAITSVPATVMGSPRYMRRKFEDAVALANKLGNPSVFVTFTASSQWREIKETLDHDTWANHPFVVVELFKKKYEKLLDVVIGKPKSKGSRDRSKGLWGKVIWYTFSVEFQQRGPPHIHLLLRLENPPKTGDDVDRICSAVLPIVPPIEDPKHEETKRLRNLVEMHHVHRPCEKDMAAYCNVGRKDSWKTCKKNFPKPFKEQTELGDKKYPDLKRPDNGEYCEKKVKNQVYKADNRHVVAYNPTLLMMFESHCNVEIVTSSESIKYLYKYVFKGFDRALLETMASDGSSYGASGQMTQTGHLLHPTRSSIPRGVQQEREDEAVKLLKQENIPLYDENHRKTVVYDETKLIEDMRAFTPTEAAWHLSSYRITGGSHTVTNVFVHQPNEEPVFFKEGEEEDTANKDPDEFKTSLKAWFIVNADDGEDGNRARELTFEEMPRYFSYQNHRWMLRKKDWSRHTIGHIKSVHPRNIEQFAIRLLASVRKGPTSFEELRTIDGVIFDSFVAAAKELNLMNDQKEWSRAIKEAAETENPIVVRRLFISILVFNAPINPLELWLENKEKFYEHNNWSIEEKEAQALHHIQSGLHAHSLELFSFGLPEIDASNLPQYADLDNDNGEVDWTLAQHQKIAESQYEKLNSDQKKAMDTICEDLERNKNRSYFVHGTGGTGKTFLYKTLYHQLRAKGKKVLCVAHTGIAATLLPNGQTSHRAFNLPLLAEENMHSKIEYESSWADHLEDFDVVIFDEATMVDRRVLTAIHEIFVNLHRPNQGMLFGGVTFLFGGDWRQTLPIIDGVRDQGVLEYTIQRSTVWNNLKLLHLSKNERAASDPDYAAWLLKMGNGEEYVDEKWQLVQLPERIMAKSEKNIMTWVFGRNRINNSKTSDYSCVLSVDNKTTEELNDEALEYIDGKLCVFKSIDTYDPKSGLEALPPETYNTMLPSGMPPHILKLKIGCIVILLRNLNVNLGLCNGTRMRVIEIGNDIIKCRPIMKTHSTPDVVVLSRMEMTSAKPSTKNVTFIRLQFPIRVAHAMTINKSQGQTLDRVGIILRTPVFSHGQLYVALSRVRRFADVKVFIHNADAPNTTRNVVYHDILI